MRAVCVDYIRIFLKSMIQLVGERVEVFICAITD